MTSLGQGGWIDGSSPQAMLGFPNLGSGAAGFDWFGGTPFTFANNGIPLTSFLPTPTISAEPLPTPNGTTLAIGLNATFPLLRPAEALLTTFSLGYYFDTNSGEFGWYETNGSGNGYETGASITFTANAGNAESFASPFVNNNAGAGWVVGSTHFDPATRAWTGTSFGLGLQPGFTASISNTTTVLHPIYRGWGR